MPNVAMWGRALTVMPRVSKPDWEGLDLVSRWLIATRSAVIVMTFTSSAYAGLLAVKTGAFDGLFWALVTLGLCLAHATNNLINDLTDHWKGVDADNYFRTQYGPQTVEEGYLSVRQMITYVALTGLAALCIGLYLVAVRGEVVLWLLGSGAFFVLFYTWPLKYIGLGEPAVLLVWGPLMVGGAYYVITGVWSNEVAVASLAYAFGPTAVLFGKHIDKLDADRNKGIRTLAVILGERSSRWVVVALLLGQYIVVGGLIATGFFGPALLACLLALPSLRQIARVYREPRPEGPPAELPEGVWPLWFVAAAFAYTRRFGTWFLVGLVLDLLWEPLARLLGA
ncbi:MAG: prenyltransferase [Deltaproteobacteria bacterium]|jgi:1,4-dihydroxy-2-naphthoate octaprenyltransferase|nr:prenyltransferase [Deltaproteobacteria bacterium]